MRTAKKKLENLGTISGYLMKRYLTNDTSPFQRIFRKEKEVFLDCFKVCNFAQKFKYLILLN